MCENYVQCYTAAKSLPKKKLTFLLLDCWQREYDCKPFKNFRFRKVDFEERMGRKFMYLKDFEIITEFLLTRDLDTVYMTGVAVSKWEDEMIFDFIQGLVQMHKIELKLMELPSQFHELLLMSVKEMKVTDLSFEGTPIDTEDIPFLQLYLKRTTILESLNVCNCSITQFDFPLIADGVFHCDTLRRWSFSRLLGGKISLDTGKIATLVSCIIWQNKLTELVMQHCEFKARDMEVIAEYMRMRNCCLRKLDVAYNKIGSDGAEYLLVAIACSGTLTHLNLSGNSLGDHGGDVIGRYMTSCLSLVHLYICYNEITAEAMNFMLEAMKKIVPFEMFKFWGNKFNDRSGRTLRRLIEARVLPQENIDVTYTYDESIEEYRVVPYF